MVRTANAEVFRERRVQVMVKTAEIMNLLRKNGYRSVYEFAQDCGMDGSNVKKNIDGKYIPGMKTMFVFAETLHVSIELIISLFYPKDYKHYLRTVKKSAEI